MAHRIETGDGLAFARSGDVLIVVWHAAARTHRFRWLQALVEAVPESAGQLLACQIIHSSSAPPDGPSRIVAKQVLSTLKPRLRDVLSVPLGDGLWHSLVRSIMRTMTMMAGMSGFHTILPDVPAALDEIERRASARTPPKEEVRRLIDEMERRLAATTSPAESNASLQEKL